MQNNEKKTVDELYKDILKQIDMVDEEEYDNRDYDDADCTPFVD